MLKFSTNAQRLAEIRLNPDQLQFLQVAAVQETP